MSDIQTAVAAAIKVRLTRLGVSQETCAEKAGMSPASLSARLTGRTLLDTRDFDTIAVALGLEDGFALVDLARAERLPGRGAAA